MHACNHFRRRQYCGVCAVFVYRTQRVLAVAAQHVGDRAWFWHRMIHAVLWPVTLRPCACWFFCRFLHAHSGATIGGGYSNTASSKCVIAVAAQRRSGFVHVLVSVTARPCACVRSLSPVTVWPCVCHYCVGPYASSQSLRRVLSAVRFSCPCFCPWRCCRVHACDRGCR